MVSDSDFVFHIYTSFVVRPFLWYQSQGHLSRSRSNRNVTFFKKMGKHWCFTNPAYFQMQMVTESIKRKIGTMKKKRQTPRFVFSLFLIYIVPKNKTFRIVNTGTLFPSQIQLCESRRNLFMYKSTVRTEVYFPDVFGEICN